MAYHNTAGSTPGIRRLTGSCFDLINHSIQMLDYGSMSSGIKFRLAAFSLAIAVMVGLMVYAGQSAWRRGNELREKLTFVQLQGFQIADHFQQTIWELNNIVLRYGAYRDTSDWARFKTL